MKPTKNSYEDSCSRPNKIMKTPVLRKSKYYINTGSFRHHTTTVAPLTHWWQRRKRTNCLLHTRVLNLKKFLHESSYDVVSGTDNDEQSLKNLSKCLSSLAVRSVLLISKRQYTSCKCSKRRALIIEDGFKILTLLIIVNRVIFNRLVPFKINPCTFPSS